MILYINVYTQRQSLLPPVCVTLGVCLMYRL